MAAESGIYPIEGAELQYRVQKNKITITGVSGNPVQLDMPAVIDGLPVTTIGKKAFLSKKKLCRVHLPESIDTIEDWAFAYCDGLQEISLPDREIIFGRAVFLDCVSLNSLCIAGRDEDDGALLAAAVTRLQASYLLRIAEVGSADWTEKLDAAIAAALEVPDTEGYQKQVLCGEEDYGSTDMEAYLNGRRKSKVRLCLVRLCYPKRLKEALREKLELYLQKHTKGCASEEAWQVIWSEYGENRTVYELFAKLGCITGENLQDMLADLGEEHPELKAYLLRFQKEHLGYRDVLGELLL